MQLVKEGLIHVETVSGLKKLLIENNYSCGFRVAF